LYQIFLDQIACEHSARMVAMKNATENAAEVIDELKQKYNSARQSKITAEIAEVTAGAAALS
jgi:F-type H+-transporting ATPase subunit gamma